MMPSNPLSLEWTTLQNNIEQYEKSSLPIKLLAVLFCALGIAIGLGIELSCMVLLVLWIMEGVLRTSQSRLCERILCVEQLLAQAGDHERSAFQLHTQWLAARSGPANLIIEYVRNALRPTVAFPYPVLIVSVVLLHV